MPAGIEFIDGKPKLVWGNDESFSSQYSTPIYFRGHLYGTAGREDFANGSFRCVEAETGKVKWSEDGIPVGHTFLVDGQLVLFDSDGHLRLIELSESRFKESANHRIVDGKARAIPAVSNGKFYVRTNASRQMGELSCFQIGESK